jgi:hypothetical protein
MAEIVAAFGVPHTPNFPALVAKQGPDCRTARLFAKVANCLHEASPDVLVIYTDDHLHLFSRQFSDLRHRHRGPNLRAQ